MGRRGRGRGRGRGRPRKKVIESDDEEQIIETSEAIDNLVEIPEEPAPKLLKREPALDENVVSHSQSRSGTSRKRSRETAPPVESDEEVLSSTKCDYNIDDISELVPPTFSTISLAPPQPMLDLNWDHEYVPLGEKVPNPNIHFCEVCRLPVRIYGRMIPCKHIFCYKCACDNCSKCPRCGDRVHRVEKSHLGSVFMCSHEGSRYGFDGCRRTYLSQRDLQAHIDHRHKPRGNEAPVISSSKQSAADTSQRSANFSRSPYSASHSPRSNLISVPVHGGSRGAASGHSKFGTSPEMPSSSSSTRYERRGSRSSQNQHETGTRSNKWNLR